MSKRLQVLYDNEEYLKIQASARRCRMTVAEWVRQALRRARQNHPATVEAKLAAVSEAASREFTTADIDAMFRKIEAGHAVMRSNRVNRILSFDHGFDAVPGIERLN